MNNNENNSDKRSAILEAALILFEKDGYSATPIPRISEMAKVATGTIYLYFPSKEELVNAVWRKNKLLLQEFLSLPKNSILDFKSQFQKLYQSYLEFAILHPVSFSFLAFHYHKPYLNNENIALDEIILGSLIEFLKIGQKNHLIKKDNPEVLLALLDGGVSGLFKSAKDGKIQLNKQTRNVAEKIAWRMISLIPNS